jgi:hypothetical protein
METIDTYLKNNANTQAREYSNKILRDLLKEMWNISNMDIPRKAKHSSEMKLLFDLEKKSYNNWSDQYCNVRRAIEFEILHRIRTDRMI